MNRDFLLPVTPANARRLLLLKRFRNIDLPDNIMEIANRDRIGESHFDPAYCPYTPIRASVMQFLLDCNLRGIVQVKYNNTINEFTIINIVRYVSQKVTVLTTRPSYWEHAVRVWQLADTDIRYQVNLTNDWVDQRRDSPLIIDSEFQNRRNGAIPEYLLREFPQVILYDRKLTNDNSWEHLAHALFPTMPNPLEIKRKELCLFYNCCRFL